MTASIRAEGPANISLPTRSFGATSSFFIVSFLLMSSLSSAQNSCPEGFRYAGTLSGSDTEQFDKTVALELPEFAMLDESYQQTRVRPTNEKGKAKSNLRPQDIPRGMHLIPYGSSDLEKVWAVSEPQLVKIKDDSNASSARYAFGMHLFCSVNGSRFPRRKWPAMWTYRSAISQGQTIENHLARLLLLTGNYTH